ncbi:endolytic transglycosylase MltG [Arthrobacter sp. MPF02]|uniref:endolytic transglycosylase MltG n=1 Tax=Arthrobacter sp. MPF02 TaxID=3388492 RepID=UPI003984E5BB
MSPANIDDVPGQGNARPLTRKELRAREKSLDTGSQGTVPEQAYETGHDVPPPPAEPPVVPAAPAGPPSIQKEVPEDAGQGHDVPVPQQHEPEPETAHAPAVEPAMAGHQHAPETHYLEQVRHTEPGHHDRGNSIPAYHDGTYDDNVHHDAVHYEDVHDDGYHHGYHDDGYHDGTSHHGLLAGSSEAKVVARPSKKVRRRRRMLALFLTLAVFVTAVAVGAQFLKPLLGGGKPSDFPGPGSGEVQVTVDNGEGTRSVALDLESKGVVANADTFLQAFSASGGVLAPGDYVFKSEMKNSDAVDVLLGQDKAKVIYFALSAGLRINESLQAISEGSGVSIQDLQALSNQPSQFGLPANAKNLEGYLAPGEHRFPLGTPAKDILQALVKITTDELVSQGITDPARQYEAVIVASIVQAEGGQAEYGDVAGAIYNRLKPNDQTNGFLQVDSAVTYGLGTKSYNFTDEQRQDKSNPYNTYANPGLPPGPIGSPGKTAIDAAAKPKSNDYLYWVTINLDTKETKFSRTLAEHNVYVEQYNAWCMANVGRCA